MDSSVRIWYLKEDIEEDFARNVQKRPEEPILSFHYPIYATGRIHGNYIDCAKFFYPNVSAMTAAGFKDILIASKSIHNGIIIWKPIFTADEFQTIADGASSILMELKVPMCDIWYIRFFLMTRPAQHEDKVISANNLKSTIYCGSRNGKIYVHELDHCKMAEDDPCCKVEEGTGVFLLDPVRILTNPFSKQAVRQVSVNRDCSILVAVCDESRIFQFSLSENKK